VDKEIEALAKDGDIRSPIKGTVNEVPVSEGDEVLAGQVLIVLEAMNQLKPRQRHILVLRCYEQMKYSQIAREMGCTEFQDTVTVAVS
jgi:DNA-directed RNA polymerase specialized sigma24 family protein